MKRQELINKIETYVLEGKTVSEINISKHTFTVSYETTMDDFQAKNAEKLARTNTSADLDELASQVSDVVTSTPDLIAEPTQTPVVETPVVAAPVVETPVVVAAPVVETPVVAPAPVVEAPIVEAPVVAPVVETPVVEAPVVETPVVAPVVETPAPVAPATPVGASLDDKELDDFFN